MDLNIILDPAVLRIAGNDDLVDILGEVRVVKGSKKYRNMENPCFTVENSQIKADPGRGKYQGSFLVSFYADDYKSGNTDLELLGQVIDKVKELFNDRPFNLDLYKNYYLKVSRISRAEYDVKFPDQHYMVIEVKYRVVKTA